MLIPTLPYIVSAITSKGAAEVLSCAQFTTASETKTKSNEMNAMIIVPNIRMRGITLLASLTSSARKVGLSQPKKVSAMKKIASKTMYLGKGENGMKLAKFIWNKPGRMRANKVTRVIKANITSMVALSFIPLKAMKLKIRRKITEMIIVGIGTLKGSKYLIAPTVSIANVIFAAMIVSQPIRKEGNLP
jgi:hypothetical protein